jgi:hypothetical protein
MYMMMVSIIIIIIIIIMVLGCTVIYKLRECLSTLTFGCKTDASLNVNFSSHSDTKL